MFFIGFFGIDSKEKRMKVRIEGFECHTKRCTGRGTLIRYHHHFHIFFIPIFRWGEEFFVTCDTCHAVYKLDKEKGRMIAQEKGSLTYWDLQEFRKGTLHFNCMACGFQMDETYQYCPKCGTKV